jgi:hypothetical protein
VDHVAVWTQVVAILGAAAWYVTSHTNFSLGDLPLLFLLALVSLGGLFAGVGGAITRKSGDRWWPVLVGILPGAALVVLIAALFIGVLSNPCGFTYC